MKIEKHLNTWVKNNLITAEQSQAILAYEANQGRRSWVVIGIAGLGIIALLLGVISLVAANWAMLGDNLKLAVYFIVQALLGYHFYRRRDEDTWVREVLLSLFALLFLAGIGLVGQIYHLKSDGYSALFLWCLITLPASLLARWSLLPNIWHIIFVFAVTFFSAKFFDYKDNSALLNCYLTLAFLFHALGIYKAGQLGVAEKFRETSFRYSTLALAGFTYLANVLMALGSGRSQPEAVFNSSYLAPLIGLVVAIVAVYSNRKIRPPLYSFTYCSALIGIVLFYLMAEYLQFRNSPLLGCFLFIVVWSLGAVTAIAANHKRVFDFISLVIAIRLLVVYFEVFGSLAMTGIGLILTGVIILGTMYVWHKYRGNLVGFFKFSK